VKEKDLLQGASLLSQRLFNSRQGISTQSKLPPKFHFKKIQRKELFFSLLPVKDSFSFACVTELIEGKGEFPRGLFVQA